MIQFNKTFFLILITTPYVIPWIPGQRPSVLYCTYFLAQQRYHLITKKPSPERGSLVPLCMSCMFLPKIPYREVFFLYRKVYRKTYRRYTNPPRRGHQKGSFCPIYRGKLRFAVRIRSETHLHSKNPYYPGVGRYLRSLTLLLAYSACVRGRLLPVRTFHTLCTTPPRAFSENDLPD